MIVHCAEPTVWDIVTALRLRRQSRRPPVLAVLLSLVHTLAVMVALGWLLAPWPSPEWLDLPLHLWVGSTFLVMGVGTFLRSMQHGWLAGMAWCTVTVTQPLYDALTLFQTPIGHSARFGDSARFRNESPLGPQFN